MLVEAACSSDRASLQAALLAMHRADQLEGYSRSSHLVRNILAAFSDAQYWQQSQQTAP